MLDGNARMNLATFLNVSPSKIAREPDSLRNPKAALLSIAAVSRSRSLREALVRMKENNFKVGPDYNGTLIRFVDNFWDLRSAADASESLRRSIEAVKSYSPHISLMKQRR